MGQSSMSEEQVGETIEVLHLDICAGENIRLLVILNQPNSDVRLTDGKLVGLLRDDADHIAKLALHSELTDSFDDKLSLDGRH